MDMVKPGHTSQQNAHLMSSLLLAIPDLPGSNTLQEVLQSSQIVAET